MVRVRENTDYGYKIRGRSNFVVIAPHAAGDDLRTAYIARLLGRRLHGSVIVNNKFYKETNKKAVQSPEFAEDFNRLSWSNKHQRHFWRKKKPAMKVFYQDIAEYCDEAKLKSHEGKAVAIYLHGMKYDKIAFDFGTGLRSKKRNMRFQGSYECDVSTGVPTLPIKYLKMIKRVVEPLTLKEYNLPIGLGENFPAWSRRIGVQFHKFNGRNDYAIQLEITKELKNTKEQIDSIINILSQSLKTIFR